ncbi:MAG: 23S rRNA (uracil(1939)-C(5))-methyltransferase RlmD [Mailhella sp.]|nr:23S rRNA (uracil(1939)-C(5))-methyltransferase RlmD [Mailhella sp.]
MIKQNLLELEIQGLSSDGRAVGRTKEGLAVFVQHALPGQRVLAHVTRLQKHFAEAQASVILRRSAEERAAPCPHAGSCGGCPWQTLPYDAQLRWKRRIVLDAMIRIGRLNIKDSFIPLPLFAGKEAPLEWGYRNKMEFCFARGEDGGTILGLRERYSHRAFSVLHCRLQTARTMKVLEELRRQCEKHGLYAAPASMQENASKKDRDHSILRFAVVREPKGGGCMLELITLPAPATEGSIRQIGGEMMRSGSITGFVHSIRTAQTSVAYGERAVFSLGEATLSETLSIEGIPLDFRLGHASFFQVNSQAAELLYSTAVRLASELFEKTLGRWGKSCWDIYCGVGGLALSMSRHFDHVYGLETAEQAVRLARQNACINGLDSSSFSFESGDASLLESRFTNFGVPDLLVADPPRAGMDAEVTRALLKHQPQNLLLVSCNPATLARDLARLAPAYSLRAVQPVDLFPQTPHVETVVLLCRKHIDAEKQISVTIETEDGWRADKSV